MWGEPRKYFFLSIRDFFSWTICFVFSSVCVRYPPFFHPRVSSYVSIESQRLTVALRIPSRRAISFNPTSCFCRRFASSKFFSFLLLHSAGYEMSNMEIIREARVRFHTNVAAAKCEETGGTVLLQS